MKCAKIHKLVHEYIDKTLNPDEKIRVEEHLKMCTDCRSLMDDLARIQREAGELEDLSPSEDGWNWIEKELVTEKRVPVSSSWVKNIFSWAFQGSGFRYAAAAVLLLAVIVSVSVVGLRIGSMDGFLAEGNSGKQTLAKLKRAETHYRKAIRALGGAISTKQNRFDPEVYQAFQKHLDVLDNSIQACRQAILDEPSDIDSRNYLLAVYKEKADLLSNMMAVSDNSSQISDLRTTL